VSPDPFHKKVVIIAGNLANLDKKTAIEKLNSAYFEN
jgi:hypothetical protein